MRIPLPSEQWRHLKTMKLVNIVSLARDEASGDTLVTYVHVEPRDDSPRVLWSRPLKVFIEVIDGRPRFGPAELHPLTK